MKVSFYIELPLWIVFIIVCLVVFPFGALIGFAGLIFTLIRVAIWYAKRRDERRKEAIAKAVAELPESEQREWQNREGRYSNPRAIPRNLSEKFVTADEKRQRAIANAVAELSENERVEWQNREGRYSNPKAVPRNLPKEFMTAEEQYRYANRMGEFDD